MDLHKENLRMVSATFSHVLYAKYMVIKVSKEHRNRVGYIGIPHDIFSAGARRTPI